jgi:hypothetical protein
MEPSESTTRELSLEEAVSFAIILQKNEQFVEAHEVYLPAAANADLHGLPWARLPAAANADLHGQLQDGALAGAYPAGGAGNGSENGKYRIPVDWPYHAKRMLPISESPAIAA